MRDAVGTGNDIQLHAFHQRLTFNTRPLVPKRLSLGKQLSSSLLLEAHLQTMANQLILPKWITYIAQQQKYESRYNSKRKRKGREKIRSFVYTLSRIIHTSVRYSRFQDSRFEVFESVCNSLVLFVSKVRGDIRNPRA